MCDIVNLDYLEKNFDKLGEVKKVLEVGSFNANGNSKEFTQGKGAEYLGIDITEGPDVDLICDITKDPEEVKAKLDNQEFDLVVCMNVLEHIYEPVKALNSMKHLVKKGGYLLVITPILWDLHDWPHDFYRLNPDFYLKYGEDNDLKIVEDSFLFSVRNTRKFYKDMKTLPMIVPDIYKTGLRSLLLRALARVTPELRQCWPHTYINLIYKKQ